MASKISWDQSHAPPRTNATIEVALFRMTGLPNPKIVEVGQCFERLERSSCTEAKGFFMFGRSNIFLQKHFFSGEVVSSQIVEHPQKMCGAPLSYYSTAADHNGYHITATIMLLFQAFFLQWLGVARASDPCVPCDDSLSCCLRLMFRYQSLKRVGFS